MEKRHQHLDNAFKKDTASEDVAVAGPADNPGRAFARRWDANSASRPSRTGQTTVFACRSCPSFPLPLHTQGGTSTEASPAAAPGRSILQVRAHLGPQGPDGAQIGPQHRSAAAHQAATRDPPPATPTPSRALRHAGRRRRLAAEHAERPARRPHRPAGPDRAGDAPASSSAPMAPTAPHRR